MLILAIILLGIAIILTGADIIYIFQSKDNNEYEKRYKTKESLYRLFTVSFILTVIMVVSIYKASMIYPKLLSCKATAISLQSEIIRIKKSYYPQKSSGKFIGGSLDNMKQSTALSLYIAKYAKAKAKFNASLAKNKAICSMPIYWIFGSNIVMDCNAITNMKNL